MKPHALQCGDVVTLHAYGREYRAMYRGHDQHASVVEIGASAPLTVRWDNAHVWISDPATGEAFHIPTDDPVLELIIPDRE